MFGIGMPELVIIMILALVVIGPHKLPELARSLGKSLNEFKKAADDLQQNIKAEASKKHDETALHSQDSEPNPDAGVPHKQPAL